MKRFLIALALTLTGLAIFPPLAFIVALYYFWNCDETAEDQERYLAQMSRLDAEKLRKRGS